MKLTPRLRVIAELVDPGAKIIDVGTDHGYIPLYLMENQIVQKCIASDMNEGPLKAAKDTLNLFGLEDMVSLRLGDGLQVMSPRDDIDTIIIAGMGGETIVAILEQGLNLVDKKTMILQPMTEVMLVREYLASKGFNIIDERLTREENRFYEVIKAVKGKDVHELTYGELRFGPILLKEKSKTFSDYIKKQILKNERIISNLENGKNTLDKIELLKADNILLTEVLEENECARNNSDN